MALIAKNKFGFLDGLIKQQVAEDLAHGSWIRCDTVVTSWIMNSVSKEIASSMIYLDTAEAVWRDSHKEHRV